MSATTTFHCESGTHDLTITTTYGQFEEIIPYHTCPFCEGEDIHLYLKSEFVQY